SDMDILAWEKLHHFTQHIFQEIKGVFTGTINAVIAGTPSGPYIFIFNLLASQFGISGNGCGRMARRFNLRDHGYKSLFGIVNDLFNLLLGIKSAGSVMIIIAAVIQANHRRISPGTDLSQFWILLDLNTPSLVASQMPVEPVHLIHGQQVDIFFDKPYGH